MEDRAKELKMSIPERQAELMKILEKDGGLDMLKDWPEEDARRARQLLMEYHDVFSLDKNEMGCTDTTEHVIKLTKSEPFKERFRRIAPPLVEEVREHIQEMLDGGSDSSLELSLVQCRRSRKKEGRHSEVLHRFLTAERLNRKRLVRHAKDDRHDGNHGGSQNILDDGFEVGLLASEDGGRVSALYSFYGQEFGGCTNFYKCRSGCVTLLQHFNVSCKTVSAN